MGDGTIPLSMDNPCGAGTVVVDSDPDDEEVLSEADTLLALADIAVDDCGPNDYTVFDNWKAGIPFGYEHLHTVLCVNNENMFSLA
jgi:hypothetical protein